jgi:hypothetical protein
VIVTVRSESAPRSPKRKVGIESHQALTDARGVVALGGTGSAVLLAAAALRFRTPRALELTQSNTEETAS